MTENTKIVEPGCESKACLVRGEIDRGGRPESTKLSRPELDDVRRKPDLPAPRWILALLVVTWVAWAVRDLPAWAMMWMLAGAEFLALKFVTLAGVPGSPPAWRIAAYVFLWPGMNARRFLEDRSARVPHPVRFHEPVMALLKILVGAWLMIEAATHAFTGNVWFVGWMGMLGLIFTLHFGTLHLVSWLWRQVGVDAPAIMRSPGAATSLANLWGERWNIAFADAARRFLLRPLARHYGVRTAGAIVFLVSGLVHETVVSLPARGGWGGPTLYFLLQGVGIAVEKSAVGIRAGLGGGVRGRLWTLLFAVAPLPLLFHGPFVRNVIVPFYRTLNAVLT